MALSFAGCTDRDINVRNDTPTAYAVGIDMGDTHKYDVVKLLPGSDMVVREGARSLRAIVLIRDGMPNVRCDAERFTAAVAQDQNSPSRKVVSIKKCVKN